MHFFRLILLPIFPFLLSCGIETPELLSGPSFQVLLNANQADNATLFEYSILHSSVKFF